MKRILIIDDKCYEEEDSIRDGFADSGIEYVLSATQEEAMKWLKSKALFDCIVLDWYLDGETSTISQLILKHLENTYYAPVLIYSGHAHDFRAAIDAGDVSYPDNLIHEVEKGDFTDILPKITEWLDSNVTAKLSSIYLSKICDQLHRTFWKLNDIPHGNIAAVYKKVVFDGDAIDWENDFVINLLAQSLVSDEAFKDEITDLITHLRDAKVETTPEQRAIIVNRIFYFKSASGFLSNSDLVSILKGGIVSYGVLTSANCDLAQCNTKYIDFLELQELNDQFATAAIRSQIQKNQSPSHFFFPAVEREEGTYTNMTAFFKAKNRLVCSENDGATYPSVNERLRYGHQFQVDGEACVVTYLCSLLNPYRSEFSHKRSTHDSRVGIPEVYRYYKEG